MGDEEQDLEAFVARDMWLDFDGKPINVYQWVALRALPERHVAVARIGRIRRRRRTRCVVSTVWLGIDHRFWGEGPPIIYETMIFGGMHDGYMDRYSTRVEAEAGHVMIVASMEEAIAALDKPRVKREKAPRRAYKYSKGKAYAFA